MKIGMIFPGYSSQFVGMGKEFYDDFRVVQEYFEEAYNCLNLNFIKLCFASSDAELSKVANAYTSIFLISSSLSELLKENGIKPDVVAGYGIGNYAAIFSAGSMTFPDGLYLLKKLSSFYEENIPNLEVSILKVEGLSSLKLKKLLKDINVNISAYNNDSQNYISGKKSDVEKIKEILVKQKIKVVNIDPEMGLHSDLMNDVADQFKVYLEKVDFKDAAISVINGIDGKEINVSKKIKNCVVNQINSAIKWNKVIEKFDNIDLIIEVGPGNLLSEFVKQKYPDKKIVSLNKKSDLDEIKNIVSSFNDTENKIEVQN